ncbi:MAG TPA: response regulator transcription factor [Dehalococcoidia bacterium]|nr:response regulator transcription factor [Dehalococcoidia bacterium]
MVFQSDAARSTILGRPLPPSPSRRPALSIRVVLCDDHALLRETLRLLLAAHAEVEVVGEAADGREAIALCERLAPDVVLMDTAMPGLNGIDATAAITRRRPRTRVLMLSGYGQEERVRAALAAGALGYVVKNAPASELLEAIRTVHAARPYLSAQLAERASLLRPAGPGAAPISAREREVLQLVAEGASNRQIAERLVISLKTVEAHKEHIVRKLGVRGNAELIHYAIRSGLITVDTDAQLGLPTP